ncbi:MAG: transglutaminase-like domain-containing protein [Peptococcaceae bacterium]|nr:transglutaminase-like domain-containing protein [Peptococcaceae bacterium]
MTKRILLFSLIAVSISLGLYGLYDLYDLSVNSSHELTDLPETTFPFSHNPEEKTTVVLRGKTLLLRSLPNSENSNYVIVKLVGSPDTFSVKKSKNARQEAYDVKFDLQDVPNGSYTVEIYCASQKYASYIGYVNGQSLRITVHDSSIEFVEPLTLPKNQEVFSANQNDTDTLARYLKPSLKIESDHPALIDHARTITSGTFSDYDKAKAIHDWVSQNIWYDYDEFYNGIYNNKSALETLTSRTGVCIDYASLTAALFRAVDIPAKLVTGYVLDASAQEVWTQDLIAGNKGNHVWNEVYIDGRWLIMDTSYDSNNTFIDKTFSAGTGMKNRKYFDITIDLLSVDRYILPVQLDPLRSR